MTIGRRAGSVVAVAAALLAGHLLTNRVQLADEGNGPFVRRAAVGGTAHLAYADVRLTDVTPAKRLLGTSSDDLAVQASDVFVVAKLELTSTREPTLFSTFVLVDGDERVYLPSVKSGCPSSASTPTAITVHVMVCFDLPSDRLTGLSLRVARGSLAQDRLRRDDLAEFALGVTDETANAWAETEAAYLVVPESLDPQPLENAEITEDGES